MAFNRILIFNRHMVLRIGAEIGSTCVVTTVIDPELSKMKISALIDRDVHLRFKLGMLPEE